MNREIFGANLKFLREQSGVAIDDMAMFLGCNSNRLNKIELGELPTSPDAINKIKTIFKLGDKRLDDSELTKNLSDTFHYDGFSSVDLNNVYKSLIE